MTLLLQFIFWICALAMVYSYVLYPLLLRWLARDRKVNQLHYRKETEWPVVTIIMSVYNEAAVIEDKMKSLLALDYPADRLHAFIGSDCSGDGTNEIVRQFCAQRPHFHFFPFEQRRGKPAVVNELVERLGQQQAMDAQHLLLMTDASVMLLPSTLKHLVRHFKKPDIFLVDANMTSTGQRSSGISRPEGDYLKNEVLIKHREGICWGKMVGPFGGCYALRADRFHPIPDNFLVDDFYITMKAYEKGGQAINDLEAICTEPLSDDLQVEFKRKARISAGNFQNLRRFGYLVFPPRTHLGFAFLSHKVLRWLGPFFLIFALLSSGMLAINGNQFFRLVFMIQIVMWCGIPLLERVLKYLNINILPLRSVTYFVWMNVALLRGFFNYIKGIKTNVWQPTKRS